MQESTPQQQNVFLELKEVLEILNKLDSKDAKYYLETFLEKDAVELINLYEEEFKTLPHDDPLRLEVLHMLGSIGITVFRPPVIEEKKMPDGPPPLTRTPVRLLSDSLDN